MFLRHIVLFCAPGPLVEELDDSFQVLFIFDLRLSSQTTCSFGMNDLYASRKLGMFPQLSNRLFEVSFVSLLPPMVISDDRLCGESPPLTFLFAARQDFFKRRTPNSSYTWHSLCPRHMLSKIRLSHTTILPVCGFLYFRFIISALCNAGYFPDTFIARVRWCLPA